MAASRSISRFVGNRICQNKTQGIPLNKETVRNVYQMESIIIIIYFVNVYHPQKCHVVKELADRSPEGCHQVLSLQFLQVRHRIRLRKYCINNVIRQVK